MSVGNTSQKNSWIAGLLSLFPGLGQLYNEQIGKGIMLMVVFLGSLFVIIAAPIPYLFRSIFFEPGLFNDGHAMRSFFYYSPRFYTHVYPLLWLFVIAPTTMIYSVVDAVNTAQNINRGRLGVQNPPSPTVECEPPRTGSVGASPEQEALRMQAQEKMSDMNSQSSSAARAKRHGSQRLSSKFLVGMVLMAVGLFYFLEMWHYSFLDWNHLWPLIPLLFGLRLLRDFSRDHDHGQLVLGTLFTGLGALFFMESWGFGHPWRWVHDYWALGLCFLGAILILQDLMERKKRERD